MAIVETESQASIAPSPPPQRPAEKSVLYGLGSFEKVKAIAEWILRSEKMTSKESTLSGADILVRAKQECPALGISDATFIQYLSNIASMDDARITCLGKRQGYFLDEAIQPSVSGTAPLETSDTDRAKEAKLYPILVAWLNARGYRAKDTSQARKGGQWGNPDVAGVRTHDTLGQFDIELVTIEAKQSLDNWAINIFEAVSHRRFANRVYFAYAVPDEKAGKEPQDLRYYSELYGVGVLAIEMPDELYRNYRLGKVRELPDDLEIREVFHAPYHPVQKRHQSEFFKNMGVTSQEGLYTWGLPPGSE